MKTLHPEEIFFPALIGCFVSGIIGAVIAEMSDRREGRGFMLGFFLGPVGWILAACTGPRKSEAEDSQAARELRLLRYQQQHTASPHVSCGACGHTAPENHFGKHPRGGLTCPNCGVRNEV